MKLKKTFVSVLLITITLACCLSCNQEPQHEHTFSTQWTSDADSHWHAATCGHNDQISDKATHTWDSGKVTKAATHTEDGMMTYTCTVCGYTKTSVIPAKIDAHIFSDTWTTDETYHWHTSTCGHDVTADKAEHSWDDGIVTKEATHTDDGIKTFTCTVCGRTKTESIPADVDAHTFSDAWTTDETYHWHVATCGHDVTSGTVTHSWDDGVITTEPTHTEDGVKTYTCTVCGKTKTETVPALSDAHTFSATWSSDTTFHWHNATCVHIDLRSDEAEHSWDAGVISKEATHTENGIKTFTCTVCGRTKTEDIPALSDAHTFSDEWTSDENYHWHASTCGHDVVSGNAEHSWNAGVITKEATETEEGVRTYTCSICQRTKTEVIPVLTHVHTFSEEWTADESYHWYASTCGHNVISGKADHSWNDGVITTEATHTENGVKTYTCTVCGQTKTETVTAFADAHTFSDAWSSDTTSHWHNATCVHIDLRSDEAEHSWNTGVITKEATHTEDGIETFTCTVCGRTKTESIPADIDAHTFSEQWASDESYHWHASTCGHDVTSGTTAHSWNDGVITTKPTHTETGVKTYTCTVCGKTKAEILQALVNNHTFSEKWTSNESFHWHASTCGHDVVSGSAEHTWNNGVITKAATCIEAGEIKYTCAVCGEERTVSTAPKNHDYKHTETVDATCTEDGYVKYRCSLCGDEKTSVLYATGHDFGTDNTCDKCGYTVEETHVHSYVERVINPTCTEMGYTLHECSGCEQSYKDNFIEPSGHKWDEGTVTIEKTCTTDGVMTYHCQNCDEIMEDVIPKGHEYEYTVLIPATCTETGLRAAVCKVCGDTIESEIIPASHSWDEGKIIIEASCGTDGLVLHTCTECGATEEVLIPATGHTYVNGICMECSHSFMDDLYSDEDYPEYGMYFHIEDIVSAYGPEKINTYGVLLDYNSGAQIDKVGVYLTQDGTMWCRALAFKGSDVTRANYVPFLSYGSEIYYTGLNSNMINTFPLTRNSSGIYTYNNYTTIGVNLTDKYGKLLLSLFDVGQAGAKTRVFDNLDEMIAWLNEGETVCLHDYGSWIVTKEATCTEPGVKTRTCSICGDVQTELIPVNSNHSFATGWEYDEAHHWHASTCGHDVVSDKSEHSWDTGIITTEPTHTETGVKTYTCTVCGKTKTETVQALVDAHTFSDEWTSDESNHWHASTCGHDVTAGKASHSWDAGVITTEPTHTEDGEKTYTCLVCGKTRTEVIPASEDAHSFSDEWTYDETYHWHAATCGHDNLVSEKNEHVLDDEKKCTVCGYENIEYMFSITEDGVLFVKFAYIDSLPKILVIPSSINGITVTSIGSGAFYGCTGLTSITLGNSVTSIGEYAFYGCTGLTNVTIGNSVTSIGYCAFFGCTSLTSITIPSSVTSIGDYAFNNCTCAIIFAEGTTAIPSNALKYASQITSVTIPNSVTSIGNGAFYACENLTTITIPDSVTSIGSNAFGGCTGLTSITIPNSVTSIGSYAFSGCTGLTSITIPVSVASIGDYAFNNCTCAIIFAEGTTAIPSNALKYASQITSVTIPNSVTSIGNGAFYACENLTTITIPDSVTSIGSNAFGGCTGLTSITIPNSITSIGSYAFSGCTGLTSITIPASVASIGDYAFNNCTCAIYFAEGTNAIPSKALYEASKITSVTIPDSVTSIGSYAFFNCRGLTSVTIGNSVTSIGDHALVYCSGITCITIPESVTSIGDSAFEGCTGLSSITIPTSVNTFGYGVFLCCPCEIIFEDGTTSIPSNALYDAQEITSVVIPDSVECIGEYAFAGCESLTNIILPDSIVSIGNDAFYGCSGLSSISIPDSVTSFGQRLFSECSGLSEIPKKYLNQLTEIADHEFYNCSSLTSISLSSSITSIGSNAFFNCTGLESITIPNSVTSIGNGAFDGCTALTSMSIPTSVTAIQSYSFRNCSGLTCITIPTSVTKIDDCAFSGCASLSSIEIPESVTEIGERVFGGAGIEIISVPSSVISMGDSVFEDCTNLTSVTIPDSVASFGRRVFSGCSKLSSIPPVYIAKLTELDYGEFEYCKALESITIPDSVINIGSLAFYDCTSLTNISFNGIKALWGAITKGSDWNYNVPATVVHCSDGDVEI